MRTSLKKLLRYFFLVVGFSCWYSTSFAFVASDMRVVVLSPFPYSEDGVPQNVKSEMAIDVDLPREVADYFTKVDAFKSVVLSVSEADLPTDADIFVRGEILYVQGGNGAARYFGGVGGAGRASILIGIKVFDAQGQLLHEGRVAQEGTRGTNVITAWSNKKNITSAMQALSPKILPVAIAGDLETSEGVIRAIESKNTFTIRVAGKSAHAHGLFKNKKVTDVMQDFALQNLKNANEDRNLIDAIAWCLINIGESGNKEYTSSLAEIIQGDADKKIKKHAKKALENINKANQ